MKLDDEKTIFASGAVVITVGLTILTNWLPGIIPALPSCLTALTAISAAFLGASTWHAYNMMNCDQPPIMPGIQPGVQPNVQDSTANLHIGGGPAE